jgi:hypothetical protein
LQDQGLSILHSTLAFWLMTDLDPDPFIVSMVQVATTCRCSCSRCRPAHSLRGWSLLDRKASLYEAFPAAEARPLVERFEWCYIAAPFAH